MNWLIKYKWMILIGWIGVSAVFFTFLPSLSSVVNEQTASSIPSTYSSQVAEKVLQDVSVSEGTDDQLDVAMLFHQKDGLSTQELSEAQIAIDLLTEKKEALGIESILTHFEDEMYKPILVSEDSESVLAMITIEKKGRTATTISNQLSQVTQSAGVEHYYTSSPMIEEEFSQQVTSKVKTVLIIGLIILLVALVVFYRSIVTPLVILLSIGLSALVAERVYASLAKAFSLPVNMFSFYLLLAITLVAGILYANILFKKIKTYSLHNRGERSGLNDRYFHSSFKSIVITGVSLAVAFSTVLLSKFVFYQTFAIAAVGMIMITLVVVTFMPALGAVFGSFLFWPYMNRSSSVSPFLATSGFSYRRPFIVLFITLLVISPILWSVDRAYSYNPLLGASDDRPAIKGYNLIADSFGPGKSVPVQVVVKNDEKMDSLQYLTLIEQMSRQITELPGVKEVRSASRPFGQEIPDFLVSNQVTTLSDGLTKGKDGIQQISDGLSGAVESIEGSAPSLEAAGDGVNRLIEGTSKLQNGVTDLGAGVGKIANGLQDASKGAGALKAGADSAVSNTQKLVNGSKQLQDGYQRVEQGLTPLQGGVGQLQAGVGKLHSGINDGLGQFKGGVGKLQAGTGKLTAGMDDMKGKVTAGSDGLSAGLGGVDQLLDGMAATTPGLGANPYYLRAKGAVDQLQTSMGNFKAQVNGGVDNLKVGVGGLNGGLDQLNTGFNQMSAQINSADPNNPGIPVIIGGLKKVDGGLNQLAAGVGEANRNFGEVVIGQQKLAKGLGTLSGGLGELKSGIGRAADGQQLVLKNIPKLSAGLGQLGDGHHQLKDGFSSIGDKMGELGTGLGTGVDGLNQVSTGLTDAVSYLQSLSQTPKAQTAGWYIPQDVIESETFERVFDTYLSADRKVFTMEVILDHDAFSSEAIETRDDIQSIVSNVSNGTPLENAVLSIAGNTSVSADTAALANDQLLPTALLLLFVLLIMLIILTKSVTGAFSSVLTTALVTFVSISVAHVLFNPIVGGVPLFVFMIMVPILTITTVNYLIALQESDVLESEFLQSGFAKSLSLVAMGLFTITLLFSGVVALQQGAAIVLIATALCALFVIPLWLPAMTRLFGFGTNNSTQTASKLDSHTI